MKEVLKISGNKLLSGEVNISGSKNLCVSLIPAALLAKDITIIHNIPPISDVYYLINIMEQLNVKIKYSNDTLIIDTRNAIYQDLLMPEMEKLRASYYFYAILLGKVRQFSAKAIGGCRLGERPIDLHLYAFRQMGAEIEEKDNRYYFDSHHLHQAHIVFEKISVGATINAILLALQIKGTIIIENRALEPEIDELIHFLKCMGADIACDKSKLIIKGGKELHGCEFDNIPDRIEVGTYALIGASLGNNLKIKPIIQEHIQSLLDVLDVLNVNYRIDGNQLIVSKSKIQKGIIVLTSPYPGFPTDLQQPLTTFLSLSNSTSVIIESIYDNRFAHVVELNKMGANITTNNMNIIIHGVKKLKGCEVSGKDLRGAVSLVLAGLMAEGTTIVSGLEFLNRGYENMVSKLKQINADIDLIMTNKEE